VRISEIVQRSTPYGRMTSRPRILWVSSASDALRTAGSLYIRHFPRFLITFWLPLLPVDIYVAMKGENWLTWVLWFFLGFLGFSALALTVSDVCNGLQPTVLRSFRRLGWKRVGLICLNALVLALMIGGPPSAAFGVIMTFEDMQEVLSGIAILTVITSVTLAILLLYVPIIAALEENTTPLAAVQRSWALGIGYYGRTVLALMQALLLGGALVLIVCLWTERWPQDDMWARLFVTRLLMPWVFITAIVMYFDLRTRKEGYNFRVFVEDLWVN
jgi:hypothetical protein